MNKENNISNEKLFGSKTRAKLLELFFANVNKTFYVREITRVIEEQINSVRRELTNLESIGVIRNETYDNKVYYAANMRHPYAHAFQEMFGQRGAVTPGRIQQVRRTPSNSWDEYIKPVAKYLRAMMLMNRAPGQDGIDLLIIGDDRTKKLTRWAEVVEQKQGKPLDYVILSRDDFLYRKSVKDRFVMDILEMDPAEVFDPDGIIAGEGMY
jgi:Fe2+ or Zn2+ uptake regulation protein